MNLTAANNSTRAWTAVHITALIVPLAAGLIVFGWRAAVVLGLVVAGTVAACAVLRRVGRKGTTIDLSHATWSGLLLGSLLPAHLAASGVAGPDGLEPTLLWPILPATGLVLGLLVWLLGGRAGGRVSPALVAYIIIAFTLGDAIVPRLAVRAERAVTGDLLQYDRRPIADLSAGTYVSREAEPESPDARFQPSASTVLSVYASGLDRPPRQRYTIDSVIRERLPPPEDLILLGHPRPIGLASVAAVVAAGMILLFRGVIDARIPTVVLASAYATFALLPVPSSIAPGGPTWTWPLIGGAVPWDVAVTFANYELLSGPIVFASLLIAPLPSLRPVAGRWRLVFALLLGPAMAAAQRYGEPNVGPLAALLLVSLLTPLMDRYARARTLV